MSSNEIFPVPASWQGRAWIDEAAYRREYARALRDPAGFWAEHAARLDWFK
ncbi:MAG: acetyl-coenzyme A synthetase N-terminal domain-containing protein, partial [Burkholderiales bacterium]